LNRDHEMIEAGQIQHRTLMREQILRLLGDDNKANLDKTFPFLQNLMVPPAKSRR
jgi:hypothetical protein